MIKPGPTRVGSLLATRVARAVLLALLLALLAVLGSRALVVERLPLALVLLLVAPVLDDRLGLLANNLTDREALALADLVALLLLLAAPLIVLALALLAITPLLVTMLVSTVVLLRFRNCVCHLCVLFMYVVKFFAKFFASAYTI